MNVARRTVVDREDAEELLHAWHASKLGFRAFCARDRIDGRSLLHWQTTLGWRPPAEGIRLVELTTSVSAPQAVYRVQLGDVAVEVDDAFREDTLVRLLGVVSRC